MSEFVDLFQPEEPEEQGEFQKASQEEIAKRTIKTAKRRMATTADNDTGIKPSGSMFSSFAGFGKDNGKASSLAFSFLSSSANATNGESSTQKPDAASALSSSKEPTTVGIVGKDQIEYYGNLKGLNQSIGEWITKKVAQNPFCILTPIFDDYAKHLKTIQEKSKTSTHTDIKPVVTFTDAKTTLPTDVPAKTFTFASLASTNDSNATAHDKPLSVFSTEKSAELNKGLPAALTAAKPATFSFGNLTSTAPAPAFSFGGPGTKPFMFSNVAAPVDSSKPSDTNEKEAADADEDQPPKYEFVPVVEKDSFYSKRCKVFVKSDTSYADRGVGMLYLKKVEGSGKTQLLVRADTSLGKILLNILLSEGVPVKRMGKNNVMLICLPLPDAQGPTSVLIRVKDEQEADELLAEITKNQK